jgi:hypothetical protein
MMKTAENALGFDLGAGEQSVPMGLQRNRPKCGFWETWTKARMRSSAVVVLDPLV